MLQKNEGGWAFTLSDGDEGGSRAVTLRVQLGKLVDTSLIKTDVQPTFIRLMIKARHPQSS